MICRSLAWAVAVLGLTAMGCSVDSSTGREIGQVQQWADLAEVDSNRAGQSRIGDCSPEPLSIDPRWDQETAELIREAARWWEGAVGVDLGELPTADEPCEREARVEGCIARRDAHVVGADTRPAGVDIYVDALHDHGGGYWLLQRAVAHEVGHWLGIADHTERGVMASGDALEWRELTPWDVAAYESACVTE